MKWESLVVKKTNEGSRLIISSQVKEWGEIALRLVVSDDEVDALLKLGKPIVGI